MTDFKPAGGGKMRRTITDTRPKPLPKLAPGEVICPVCQFPGVKTPPELNTGPGQQYLHEGRGVACRWNAREEIS